MKVLPSAGLFNGTMLAFMLMIPSFSYSQTEANYDEDKVPAYELPSILQGPQASNEITTVEEWEKTRRSELLHLLGSEMFGMFPGSEIKVDYIVNSSEKALGNKAIRKEITINLQGNNEEIDVSLLLYVPMSKMPAPVFLGLNFYGNHTIIDDPAVSIHHSWVRNNPDFGIENNRASEANRGVRASRWPVSQIMDQGYGLATMYYGEIDPDFDDHFENGIHRLLADADKSKLSSIDAWAWVLSQALTYLQQDSHVDPEKVAVIGHSRLGKTSLWAGASDTRFALVISNNSGCGGAAISRRKFGETVARINKSFPHWFVPAFKKFNNQEDLLPFDQHTLLGLVAPRPLYVASAAEDRWADPRGEFLAAKHASVVYELYGLKTLSGREMPPVDQPILDGSIGYHVRTGGHDLTLYDWNQFIAFANRHFNKK